VFPDPKQSAAELRVEVKGASLHESLSQGKLRSMKNEIFRWKITVADSSISVSDSIIDGGMLSHDDTYHLVAQARPAEAKLNLLRPMRWNAQHGWAGECSV